MNKWDARFLDLAKHIATWSKDPSTKCGAVIVRSDRTIASIGYNGFPRGCEDNPDHYADRETKLTRTVHAELNAILNAHEILSGCTLYAVPFPVCGRCAAHIIQSGIQRVVTCGNLPERWRASCEAGLQMFHEAGIEVQG